MAKNYFSFLLAFLGFGLQAQILTIPDPVFKNVLVNLNCVDLTNDAVGDTPVDTNNDGEIQVSEALVVTNLFIDNQSLTNVEGLQYFTNLEYLICGNNQLAALPLTGLVNLKALSCYSNQLTALDITSLTALESIDFSANLITEVDFHNNPQLLSVSCSDNLLTEIVLCGTGVKNLQCSNNPGLTYISIKNNVVSGVDFATSRLIPPPLPSLIFFNLPALATICYDEGELQPIENTIPVGTTPTLITDCECALLDTEIPEKAVFTFTIAPNPVENELLLQLENPEEIRSIAIYNILGQQIQTVSGNERIISVAGLKTGMYLLELVTDHGKTTRKFLKR